LLSDGYHSTKQTHGTSSTMVINSQNNEDNRTTKINDSKTTRLQATIDELGKLNLDNDSECSEDKNIIDSNYFTLQKI
jgi:hypothetical protein